MADGSWLPQSYWCTADTHRFATRRAFFRVSWRRAPARCGSERVARRIRGASGPRPIRRGTVCVTSICVRRICTRCWRSGSSGCHLANGNDVVTGRAGRPPEPAMAGGPPLPQSCWYAADDRSGATRRAFFCVSWRRAPARCGSQRVARRIRGAPGALPMRRERMRHEHMRAAHMRSMLAIGFVGLSRGERQRCRHGSSREAPRARNGWRAPAGAVVLVHGRRPIGATRREFFRVCRRRAPARCAAERYASRAYAHGAYALGRRAPSRCARNDRSSPDTSAGGGPPPDAPRTYASRAYACGAYALDAGDRVRRAVSWRTATMSSRVEPGRPPEPAMAGGPSWRSRIGARPTPDRATRRAFFALAGAGGPPDAPRNGMPHEHMRAAHMHSMLAIGFVGLSLGERQ
jgi:hypothetical protein